MSSAGTSRSSGKGSGKSSSKGGRSSKGCNGKNAGRCSIYDEIDGLSDCVDLPEAKRFPTFIAALQRILNKMAYYVVNSDGAVLEDTEEWHNVFTSRLYEAAGQARTEAIAQRATNVAAPGGPMITAGDRAPPAALPVRPEPSSIPASLRRILNGSHESLRDDDDDPID